MMRTVYSFWVLMALSVPTVSAGPQLPGIAPATAPAPSKPVEADPLGRDTPHGCVVGFLKAAARGDYTQAAQYLDLHGAPSQGEELARQLEAVLNRGLSKNIDGLSRQPEGDLKDGLRENRDRVGRVVTSFGELDILLDRVQRSSRPAIWLFSSETLNDVPQAFEEMNTPAVERFFPKPLRNITIFSLPLWRWLVMILSLALAVALASVVTRALVRLLRAPLRRLTGQADDSYLLSLTQPIRLLLLALAIRILASFAVSVLARALWSGISAVLAVAGFCWLLMRFSNVVCDLSARQLRRKDATSAFSVLALAHRLFKMVVFTVAVIFLLHRAGVNVSAMLAGLGIGGIALALAAQKTLEDLFGGITIITRRAIRVGDFCLLAKKLGTVEEISLGSTRVRTLDRTVVTIPNAKVSQMELENYTMRDKIWFHHIFGLPYGTTPEQMRQVLSQVTEMLRSDTRVERESARIRLIAFGPSSFNLEIFAYVKVRDYTLFVEIQEDLLLQIMDIVAANGTSIALPAQITYLDGDQRNRTYREHSGLDTQHDLEQVRREPR